MTSAHFACFPCVRENVCRPSGTPAPFCSTAAGTAVPGFHMLPLRDYVFGAFGKSVIPPVRKTLLLNFRA